MRPSPHRHLRPLAALIAALTTTSVLLSTSPLPVAAAPSPTPGTKPPALNPQPLPPRDTHGVSPGILAVLPTPTAVPTQRDLGGKLQRTAPNPRLLLPPTAGIAAVSEPTAAQHLEVFAIASDGSLKDVWKTNDGPWMRAVSLTPPGFAAPGAQPAAVYQPLNQHLEVFAVDSSGALKMTYKANDGAWQPPSSLTGPGLAPPGAPVTAVWQPLNEHLEVFVVDSSGAVQDVWKAHDGAWQPAVAITPPGFAAPNTSAPLVAIWQPLDEHLEVFGVDASGAVKDVWKAHDGPWAPPITLTGPSFAAPGAPLAAAWEPDFEHLEVFGVDPNSGALNDVWKAHDGAWQPAVAITPPGFAPAYAVPSAVWQPLDQHLEVFAVDASGALKDAWKASDGAWQPPITLSGPGLTLAGEPVAGVWQPLNEHLEVFTVDTHDAVQDVWKFHDGKPYYDSNGLLVTQSEPGGWHPPLALTKSDFRPAVFIDARGPACAAFLRQWRAGTYDDQDPRVGMCDDFLGVTAYCASQNSSVAVGFVTDDQGVTHRFQDCAPYVQDDSVWDQATHLGRGIAQGLLVALPYINDALQGIACLNGTIFACATLAVDVAAQTDVAHVDPAAIDAAKEAADCVDDDAVACVQLGTRGAAQVASAQGVTIPGADAPGAARDCLNQDFLGCLQLGQMAAETAGVAVDPAQKATALLDQCSGGDVGSCVQLGQEAARVANLPTGGLPQGAGGNVQPCSQGDIVACTQLGQAIASTAS